MKVSFDKYYTRPHVAKLCSSAIDLRGYDCVVEPSAGSGSFLPYLPHPNLIALDLAPEGPGILKQNWLTYQLSTHFKRVLVIGNPPFGVNHNLSDAFISKALSFANVHTIAFILPNTYKKHTRQKLLPRHYRIAQIIDLGADAFYVADTIYHVPCSFFIFDTSPGTDLRANTTIPTQTRDFYFATKQHYDLFIFGAAPHRIISNPAPNNRGYFLKSKIELKLLRRRLAAIKWRGNSCANGGVAWFTKREIADQYNNAMRTINTRTIAIPHIGESTYSNLPLL